MIKTRVLFLFTILIQAAFISSLYFGQSFSQITNVYATSDGDGGGKEDNSAKDKGEGETTENDQGDDGKEVVNDTQPEGRDGVFILTLNNVS